MSSHDTPVKKRSDLNRIHGSSCLKTTVANSKSSSNVSENPLLKDLMPIKCKKKGLCAKNMPVIPKQLFNPYLHPTLEGGALLSPAPPMQMKQLVQLQHPQSSTTETISEHDENILHSHHIPDNHSDICSNIKRLHEIPLSSFISPDFSTDSTSDGAVVGSGELHSLTSAIKYGVACAQGMRPTMEDRHSVYVDNVRKITSGNVHYVYEFYEPEIEKKKCEEGQKGLTKKILKQKGEVHEENKRGMSLLYTESNIEKCSNDNYQLRVDAEKVAHLNDSKPEDSILSFEAEKFSGSNSASLLPEVSTSKNFEEVYFCDAFVESICSASIANYSSCFSVPTTGRLIGSKSSKMPCPLVPLVFSGSNRTTPEAMMHTSLLSELYVPKFPSTQSSLLSLEAHPNVSNMNSLNDNNPINKFTELISGVNDDNAEMKRDLNFCEIFEGEDATIPASSCYSRNNSNINNNIISTISSDNEPTSYYASQTEGEDYDSSFASFTDENLAKGIPFYAVYDGHAGTQCATFLKKKLYKLVLGHSKIIEAPETALGEAILTSEKEYLTKFSKNDSGSTAACVIIVEDKLVTANVGDTEIVLSREGKAILLSEKHNVKGNESEKKRVEKEGGRIFQGRIGHPLYNPSVISLAVSRAIGDAGFKLPNFTRGKVSGIIANPALKTTKIDPLKDDFVIIGCDGLWDVISYQEAVDFCHNEFGKLNEQGQLDFKMVSNAVANALVRRALERGTRDNVTILLINLQMLKKIKM